MKKTDVLIIGGSAAGVTAALTVKMKNPHKEVVLENGQKIPADAVVLAMGYIPNSQLALKCGLKLNEKGFIKVDEYLRTSAKDVFAVGDCAEKKDYFTRKTSTTMLASTACGEARVVGLNIYKLSTPKSFGGTIAMYSTVIGDTAFATA